MTTPTPPADALTVPAEPPPTSTTSTGVTFDNQGNPLTANTITSGSTTTGLTFTTPNGQTFSAEDLERARQQEKDKMYGRLSKAEEALAKLQEEQKKRAEAEADALKQAQEAAEAERQKNLSFEQKLAESEARWADQMASMQGALAQRDALLERERQLQQLNEYRTRRLAEEAENIMPEMHAWIGGGSEQEIDEALTRAKDTTASILAQIQNNQQNQQYAAQQMRQQARGTGITAPPVGPMENQTGQETYTADDIRNMDIQTYMKNRDRLMAAASQQMRGRGN